MAKLFQITAIKHNNYQFNPLTTMYLNPNYVVSAPSVAFTDNSGVSQVGTMINYGIAGENMHHQIVATEPPSTIIGRINAVPTTDVHSLDLTILDRNAPNSGYIAQVYKSKQNVNVDDIWLVQAYPLNNNNALVFMQNRVKTHVTQYRVEESAATIETTANS